ncbi:MAG: hypothetical protein RI531_10060, partial [Haloferacaceae archaeon]|nr:hypothetical protein [Haloferacaceae archaeon]
MGKITSVNLDEEMIDYFQRENINVSAWIRDMMQQRMTNGDDVDVTTMRIRELEDQIGLSVVEPVRIDDGWEFSE